MYWLHSRSWEKDLPFVVRHFPFDQVYCHIFVCPSCTYTEMIANGLWTDVSKIQELGFVVNTTCWNCGENGNRSSDWPSNKIGGTPASGRNSVSNQHDRLRGRGLLPEMASQILKRYLESPTSTKPLPSTRTNKPRTFWEWRRRRKLLLNLLTQNPQLAYNHSFLSSNGT